MALARSRRLGIADLLGSGKSKRKKGGHFPSPERLGAMTDSHPGAFFQWIAALSVGETFPLLVCRVNRLERSAIYRAISKLFDIGLAMNSPRL
jgi:predicted DNA-binding transcriptional regulator AlpA